MTTSTFRDLCHLFFSKKEKNKLYQIARFRKHCSAILICLSVSLITHAQTITGFVYDEENAPIVGANVLELGTVNGTITGEKGEFSLRLSSPDAKIRVSYIGYQSQTISAAGQSSISFTLVVDEKLLEEIVVIGYQSVKKSDLTGAVSKIDTEDLSEIPANNIEELVQGRVPGLVISNTGDSPGQGLNVRIRGASSFTNSTPLIVVDGFPLGNAGNLNQINPFDIVSVEVLKDASAASVYGSRGANGVILVTTRRGQEGKTKINFSSITTLSEFATDFDFVQDFSQLALLTDEGNLNSRRQLLFTGRPDPNGIIFPSPEQLADPNNPFQATDYPEFVFRQPINQNYNLSAFGGTSQSKYN
ncbi:MAG: TonB-dependent receptor plug domain-containing protein, partial [Bacteroidota bacterium]